MHIAFQIIFDQGIYQNINALRWGINLHVRLNTLNLPTKSHKIYKHSFRL